MVSSNFFEFGDYATLFINLYIDSFTDNVCLVANIPLSFIFSCFIGNGILQF